MVVVVVGYMCLSRELHKCVDEMIMEIQKIVCKINFVRGDDGIM